MWRRRSSIKLMDLFGFRIGVDRSWFLILFLLIFLLSGEFRQALHSSDGVAYLTTVVTVLILFGSLIVHELGHALVARRLGIAVRRIDLFLFGGLTEMSRDAATPGEDFKIAVAGPAATFGFVLAVPRGRPRARRSAPARRRGHARQLGQDHPGPAVAELATGLERSPPGVQPRAGVPARRRPDHASDRLAGHRREAARHPGRGQARAGLRAARRRPRRMAAARVSQLHRAVVDRDRVPALPIGPGGARANRAERPDRRGAGGRHHGPPARRDSVADRRRPGARRVLPALRVVVVPGGRRKPPVPRDRPPGAPDRRPGSRRGLAHGRGGARARAGRRLAGERGPADQRGPVLGEPRPPRGADGGRRRRRAPRRGHRRAGPPGAAGRVRQRRVAWPDTGPPAAASMGPIGRASMPGRGDRDQAAVSCEAFFSIESSRSW